MSFNDWPYLVKTGLSSETFNYFFIAEHTCYSFSLFKEKRIILNAKYVFIKKTNKPNNKLL